MPTSRTSTTLLARWDFLRTKEFEEDAVEWCDQQNEEPTFGENEIPLHVRNVKR